MPAVCILAEESRVDRHRRVHIKLAKMVFVCVSALFGDSENVKRSSCCAVLESAALVSDFSSLLTDEPIVFQPSINLIRLPAGRTTLCGNAFH